MAQTVPFQQVDVFTTQPYKGNPVAVILDASRLEASTMQQIARWTNLSETTFVLPPTTLEASYRVRIFTPVQELPFAGHPSVGTAHAVLEAGIVSPRAGRLVQECAAGLLPVAVVGEGAERKISVRAPPAKALKTPAGLEDLLKAALAGLARGSTAPCLYDNGPSWWLVEAADEPAVRNHRPDFAAITTLTEATPAVGIALYAAASSAEYQLVVRAYCPADGIAEDPVTGSANASIGALLLNQGRYGTGQHYVASQGREVGRDGRVLVRLEPDGVWIGDRSVTVVRGEIRLD